MPHVPMDGRPLDVLEATVGDGVTVRLKDGQTYSGRLAGFDQHMNLVLEAADGESADSEGADAEPVEDTTIIRGDNVVSIHP